MPAQPPGCRRVALATALLVGLGLVFMAVGLTLVRDGACEGPCQTAAFTLLYAGLPVSALLGVGFGELVVAWPLDVTLWVVVGFLITKRAEYKGRSVTSALIVVVALALAYGLVLSRFVEMVIQSRLPAT